MAISTILLTGLLKKFVKLSVILFGRMPSKPLAGIQMFDPGTGSSTYTLCIRESANCPPHEVSGAGVRHVELDHPDC